MSAEFQHIARVDDEYIRHNAFVCARRWFIAGLLAFALDFLLARSIIDSFLVMMIIGLTGAVFQLYSNNRRLRLWLPVSLNLKYSRSLRQYFKENNINPTDVPHVLAQQRKAIKMTEHRKQLAISQLKKAQTFAQIYDVIEQSHKARPILNDLAKRYNIHYIKNKSRFIIPGDNGARPVDCGYEDLKSCIVTILTE